MPISLKTATDLSLKLALLFAIVCAMVPFSPKMPATDIDYSWAIALNQAIAQGLIFGKEIIFTLGPYACLYTKVYHPSTDGMMIIGSLYLAISYWLACVFLIRKNHIITSLIFIIALLGMVYARDVLFFSYPLLLGLWLITQPRNIQSERNWLATYAVLSVPLGLLVLIKGTFLIQTILFLAITTLYFIYTNKRKAALIAISSTCISCCVFWLVAKQPLFALPAFIINSIKISLGFSEVMSSEGNYYEIYTFLAISLIQLTIVVTDNNHRRKEKSLLFSILVLFLFLSFKAGFTRHFGHAYVASTALLFSGLILSLVYRPTASMVMIILSTAGCLFINGNYTHMSLRQNIRATLSSAIHGINNRYRDPTWAHNNYQTLMSFIAKQTGLPQFAQTSDIYSYDQATLLASGNQWSPRPIFQSYSAFTTKLAEINKNKLKQNPPNHIFFRLQPIDKKVPALDDGPSWRILLDNYYPTQKVNDYLILTKKQQKESINAHIQNEQRENHQFGETILLPNHASTIFAKLTIKKTIQGKLWSLIYKPDQLRIHIYLKGGSSRTFRLSANMAAAEFLLSPLIENTSEFGLLFFSSSTLTPKYVKSITVDSLPSHSKHWQKEYTLQIIQQNT